MHIDNIDLTEQFVRICRLLHMNHHRSHQSHGPMGDPHRGQGRVLALLKMQPEISQKELSYLLDIRPQSLGELLAKLERGGFITRTPSEADNRVMNIRLTEEGEAAVERHGDDVPDLFEDLNAEEREALSGYLERVVEGMERRLGGDLPDEVRRHGHHHERHGHDRGCCRSPRHGHEDGREGDAENRHCSMRHRRPE